MKGKHFIGILSFIMLISGELPAQPYIIQGNIEHPGEGTIYLLSYYGDRFLLADSVDSKTGSFNFLLSGENPPGVYRLVYPQVYQGVRSENRYVEFIYNNEDISFNVTLDTSGPLPIFDNSLENQVYFEFVTFQLAYEKKLSKIYSQLYPALPGEESYENALLRYEEMQYGRKAYMDSCSLLYPELYACRIMNAFRAPLVSGSVSHTDRIDSLKRLFFDEAPVDDPGLLYAPVYSFRLVDYLSLFNVDSLSALQQEEMYIEAVDRIMVNVSPNQELRSFVVNYLLRGFELMGMEEVQVHLADHYLDESCESEVAELVRERMEGYKRMNVGAIAPDFTIRDVHGRNYTLSDLPNPYVLVMFWASTCGHCREMIPELKQWYMEENELDLEVVAISIDSSASLLHEYITEKDLPWITSLAHLGWHGLVPSAYYVYATPTLFLLDRERQIIARPVGLRQLNKALRKLQ